MYLSPAAGRLDACPAASAGSLHLEIVDTIEGLHRLGPEWDNLFQRSGKAHHVFQQHAFVELFARAYHLDEVGQAKPGKLAIVTGRRAGRLVLVWPLVEQRCMGGTAVSWIGEPVAQYGDVLLDAAEPALPSLQKAYAHILTTLRPDIVRLRRVRADATIGPLIVHLGARARGEHGAPCITLAKGGSGFEQRQSGKAKKNRRRQMRRLEERGTISFEEVRDAASIAKAITAGLSDKREWCGQRGLLSAALSDPRFDTFLQSAACAPGNPAGCVVFSLRLDDRQIAFALAFRCKQRLMLHVISYAPDIEKHGPGVLNVEAILRHAEALGLEAVDMLPPSADYKLDWADTSIEVCDYSWGVNARGRMWAALSDGIMRPVVKSALSRLPHNMRKRLAQRQLPKHE